MKLVRVAGTPHMFVGEFYDSNGWNEQRLRQWLLPFQVACVLKVPFSQHQEDQMVWYLSSFGDFLMSSTWELVCQRRNISLIDKLVWNSITPLKISFICMAFVATLTSY